MEDERTSKLSEQENIDQRHLVKAAVVLNNDVLVLERDEKVRSGFWPLTETHTRMINPNPKTAWCRNLTLARRSLLNPNLTSSELLIGSQICALILE